MRLQIIIYFNLALTIGIFGKSVKIVGGQNGHITEFPYMAALRYTENNQIFCGGAIITRWNILTAAHCLFDENGQYDHIRIYTGITSTTSTSGPTHEIHHVNFHPQFTGTKEPEEVNRYDIAVITLKAELKLNRYQNRVRLPTDDLRHHDSGLFSGWGLIDYPSLTLPDQLQQIPMRIFENEYCQTWQPFQLFPGQFCAYHNQGIGACKGDSGGPLVIDNEVVGIMTFSLPCATGIPDIYTKVYYFLDFIIEHLMVT